MRRVSLAVNGVRHELDLEPRELLVYVLRERLGLTGTNVGCDTSSCGACTVLLNGESVKSCTLLGVQADGTELTTIEGLAENGDAAPAPAGLPRAPRAPVRLLHARDGAGRRRHPRGQPRPERGRDPARPRGQPLPLHRLPEHRQGRSRGGGGGVMATTEKQTYIGSPVARKEDPELLTGQARFVDDLVDRRAWSGWPSSAVPTRTRGSRASTSRAAREAEGVVAAFSGADLADQWAGGLPCAWPVTEDIKLATHWPLAVDKARYAGDGVAVVIAESRALAKDAAELVQVDYEPLPAVSDVEAALGDDAPILHDDLGTNHCYTWKLEAGETERLFAEAAVTVKERYRQNRLIPNAIEPRGVIVQPVPTQGEFTMWSATQIPHILRTTLTLATGIPEAKLRVIAPDVGGGFGSKLNVYAEEALCLALARKLGRADQVDRGALGGVCRHDPRSRRRPGDRARGDRRRDDHRGAGAADGGDGRLPPARDAGDSDPRRLALRRLLRRPGLRLRVRRRLHEHDADRRLPRRRPARGDLRDRARGRRARPQARRRPGRAAPEELHPRVPGDDRRRPHDRLRRLRRIARQGARDRRLRGAARRAGRAARAR